MLIEESRWLGRMLALLPPDQVFPLLNLGSGDASYRRNIQPWIETNVFGPVAKNPVLHLDVQGGPGIDVVGDFTSPEVIDALKRRGIRSVLCSNVLEHVPDAAAAARAVAEIVAPGSYMIVTCPLVFPYHPVPIDTMFRPTVADLISLFPGTQRVRAESVTCHPVSVYYAGEDPTEPMYRELASATCVVLRKPAIEPAHLA